MSVILRDSSSGAFISHEVFLKRTYSTAGLAPADQMFGLRTPFMTEAQAAKTAARMMGESTAGPARKRIRSQKTESPNNTEEKLNEVGDVQEKMSYVIKLAKASGFFNLELTPKDFVSNNSPARQFSDMVFKQSNLFGDSASFQDKNTKNKPVLRCIRGENYVLPGNCRFFCGDLFNSMNFLSSETFDLVIVDPPWWNKYIRRIKSAARHSTYPMMYNKDLSKIPVGNYLTAEGLVAIWCTNSPNNIKELIEMVLPEWGFQSVATWFWAKVTKAGETVCAFSQPPGKQPYERIIFARKICKTDLPNPVDKQVLISVPSAVHSHKPPLTEVLAPYLPQNFKTLELFARNLLPNTTSCGLEVLKLQHEILFQKQVSLAEPAPLELQAASQVLVVQQNLLPNTTSCELEVLKPQHEILFQNQGEAEATNHSPGVSVFLGGVAASGATGVVKEDRPVAHGKSHCTRVLHQNGVAQ